MTLDLYSLNMERGLHYEGIVTTCNEDGTPNAAPMGVICKGPDHVVLRLHEGSHTISNVKREKRFYVNLSRDPLLFTHSLIGNPPVTEFKDEPNGFSLKNADATFFGEVRYEKKVEKEDAMGENITIMFHSQVQDIKQEKKESEPLNRAICGVLEALVNLSRVKRVSSKKKKEYADRLKEISRVVGRVGGPKHQQAMELIEKEFEIRIKG
ncbi:DUF447 domain-containing protein [Methanobacterium sp.]|uniref:DUF447 domain-containing protein n=1 Tax=Methanobacterium sp. TaxID=2164 RepID=UPI002AB80171|nr:DUF447 domain-containing protein [Methanobacterium sp.]MDY9924030.1 DUF447 family protein [Methanobacterium sp.]